MQCHLGKDKRKVTDLRQANTDAKRRLRGITKKTNPPEPDRELADKNQPYHDREESPIGEQCARIYEHANGDEEQRHEGIANGEGFRGERVGIMGAAEKQAAD